MSCPPPAIVVPPGLSRHDRLPTKPRPSTVWRPPTASPMNTLSRRRGNDHGRRIPPGGARYHRLPRPGKLAIEPTKRMATQRDLALAYSPGVAAACEAINADPDTAHDYTARGNLVARDLQRHRRARPRQYRRARRQAGDGGQGRPVQEIRRHRRVRHRGGRRRPRPVLRRGRRAGTHLRRHQPGGHQGPRMLRHRSRPARPHGHPGLPRRPARHRHHRRRRRAQRPAAAGQDPGRRAAGDLRRRRRRAGLRRSAGRHGPARRRT